MYADATPMAADKNVKSVGVQVAQVGYVCP
jgi:hypothetical protein